MKKKLFLSWLIFIISVGHLAGHGELRRSSPIHHGIDRDLQPYYDNFMNLATQNKIKFKNKVAMGFIQTDKHPTSGSLHTIGICWYMGNTREIDIDPSYFAFASQGERYALTLHELGHCYCGRGHEYNGHDYEASFLTEIKNTLMLGVTKRKPGFFEDGCPISLMYPIAIGDACYYAHYQQYINELFSNCNPY